MMPGGIRDTVQESSPLGHAGNSITVVTAANQVVNSHIVNKGRLLEYLEGYNEGLVQF